MGSYIKLLFSCTVVVCAVYLLGEISSMESLMYELGHKYSESRGMTRAEKEYVQSSDEMSGVN